MLESRPYGCVFVIIPQSFPIQKTVNHKISVNCKLKGASLYRGTPLLLLYVQFSRIRLFAKPIKKLLRIGHMKFSHHYLVFLLSIIFRIRASISVTTLLYSHATFSLCPIS